MRADELRADELRADELRAPTNCAAAHSLPSPIAYEPTKAETRTADDTVQPPARSERMRNENGCSGPRASSRVNAATKSATVAEK